MTVIVLNAVVITVCTGVILNLGRIKRGKKLSLIRLTGWILSLVIFYFYLSSTLFTVKYIKGNYAYASNDIKLSSYQTEIQSLNPYDKVIITENGFNLVYLIINPFSNNWFTLKYEDNTDFISLNDFEVFQLDTTSKGAIRAKSYISDGSVCYAVDLTPDKVPNENIRLAYANDSMASVIYNGDILYCYTEATIID